MKKWFFLFCFFSIPAFAQECTEKMMYLKKDKTLYFLTQAITGQNKQSEFIEQGLLISTDFSTIYARYQYTKTKSHLNQMCLILDQMIDLANDLLAGGTGWTHKTPWNQHTPNELFQLEEKIIKTCTNANIEEERSHLFQSALDGEDPIQLIEKHYQKLTQCLEINPITDDLKNTVMLKTKTSKSIDDLEKATLD